MCPSCVCRTRLQQEASHLSVRLYFLFSLVVSCCRAGYVCGGHLKLVNNSRRNEGRVQSGARFLVSTGPYWREVSVLLHPATYYNGDKVNWGGGIFCSLNTFCLASYHSILAYLTSQKTFFMLRKGFIFCFEGSNSQQFLLSINQSTNHVLNIYIFKCQ